MEVKQELSVQDQQVLRSLDATTKLIKDENLKSYIQEELEKMQIDPYFLPESLPQSIATLKNIDKQDERILLILQHVAQNFDDEQLKEYLISLILSIKNPSLLKTKTEKPRELSIPQFFEHVTDMMANQNKDAILKLFERKELIKRLEAHKPGILLLYAAEWGNPEVVKKLIDVGIKVNRAQCLFEHEYPLHTAAAKGYGDVVELLLNAGAQDSPNKNNDRALDLALQKLNAMREKITQKKQEFERQDKAYSFPFPYSQQELESAKNAALLLKLED